MDCEYAALFKKLLDNEAKFRDYFRMFQHAFNILYNIQGDI